MRKDFVGVREVRYSDKAYRLTIPGQIPLAWNKAGHDKIPVCFFQFDGKIVMEPLDDVLKQHQDYPDEVIKRLREKWIEFSWKRDMFKRRLLQKEYIKGHLTEKDYRKALNKHFEMYQKITQELRKTLLDRGLAFTEIEKVEDVAELDLLFVEAEKDENVSELLREIRLVVNGKRQIAELLEVLKQRMANELIPADIGKFTKRDLERQLMLATRRVEKIRNCIAEM